MCVHCLKLSHVYVVSIKGNSVCCTNISSHLFWTHCHSLNVDRCLIPRSFIIKIWSGNLWCNPQWPISLFKDRFKVELLDISFSVWSESGFFYFIGDRHCALSGITKYKLWSFIGLFSCWLAPNISLKTINAIFLIKQTLLLYLLHNIWITARNAAIMSV